MQRTDEAEIFVEQFAGVPLTAECVYYSPQRIDRGSQKEVCDFLIILRDEAILVSMKSQEDPASRSGEKLGRWTTKAARKALRQAEGAIRTLGRERFWCRHSRRGRVDFEPSSIRIVHAVVITELFGDPIELPDEFGLSIGDIPVTYLSVNDFCNLIEELRTFRDISNYLLARRVLPAATLRSVGAEKALYEYWIVNEQTFVGCHGHEEAQLMAAARETDLEMYLYFKPVRDRFANIIEFVSDQLAKRLDNYTDGLDPRVLALYDDATNRRQYLLMQEELCDLTLPERHALGMQFLTAIEKLKRSERAEDMVYAACHMDSKPEFLYVLISSKGVTRLDLMARSNALLRGGMTAYGKTRGMVIADRDGKNFEIMLSTQFTQNDDDLGFAREHFNGLRVFDVQLSWGQLPGLAGD
jgi:hypothetical protein